MHVESHVVALDGPAGSGKSTVARAVASRLGFDYLDTGAMYRAVAFEAIRRGVDPQDAERVGEIAKRMDLEVGERVVVNGADATIEIRGPEVTRAVSSVAAHPRVRSELVLRQREWATGRAGVVMEGRDIATVVFPDAQVKVFLTASEDARADRRSKEMRDRDYSDVAADMVRRDRADSTRAASPLSAAADAVVLDTTALSCDEVVDKVLEIARSKWGGVQ